MAQPPTPQLAPERSERCLRRMSRAVDFVTRFLAELTDSSLLGVDVAGRDVVRVAAMPKTAIFQAQGLAFIRRRKKGVLVSLSQEEVVLIWRQTGANGETTWSGPVFLKGKSYGAGFTVGFMNMRLCLAIMNSKGVSSVLRPHHNTGVNCSFFADMNSSKLRALRTSSAGEPTQVNTDARGGMQARYYLLEACIVDVSANGGYFGPDAKMNRDVYGADVTVEDVLQGRVPPPPEFAPLYEQLAEYEAAVRREHRGMTRAKERSMKGGRLAAEVAALGAGKPASPRLTLRDGQRSMGHGSTGSGPGGPSEDGSGGPPPGSSGAVSPVQRLSGGS